MTTATLTRNNVKVSKVTVPVNSLAIMGNPFASGQNPDDIKDAYGQVLWAAHRGLSPEDAAIQSGLEIAKTWRRPSAVKLRAYLDKLVSDFKEGAELIFSTEEPHASRIRDYVKHFAAQQ
jgi:hypothetical protein